MYILPKAMLVLVSMSLPLADAFAQTDQEPPTAVIVADDFSGTGQAWQPVSGRWAVTSGTYGDSSAGSRDITTIPEYRGLQPAEPPDTQIRHQDFFVRARMRNEGTADTHFVGLVYGYQDAQNYYEVVVSALGAVRMRTVMNGIPVDEVPAVQSSISRNTWFEVEVRWSRGVASLKINGNSIYTSVSQPEFTTGKVGLVTYAAVGRFDKVVVGVPFGDQGFLETFDEPPYVTFTPQSGQWTIANGVYRNNAVQQTNITLAPIHTGFDVGYGDTIEYTFRARLLNPYGASGNLVGIVFNYEGSKYSEVVFSPTGVAKVNRVENGTVRTLATASYGGRPNVPFEVAFENSPNSMAVNVDGVRLFHDVPSTNPNLAPQGGVGLITHWSPGRFENIQFDHGVFQPCSLTFDTPPPSYSIVGGTWNTNGGTLNDTSAGQSDIVNFNCLGNDIGDDAGTDTIYSARLLNEYGASGNRVGLIYNYQDSDSFYAGDYFEVVFSPTGILQLNKFIQGVRYPVRTLAHDIPRNTWFNVQVIRSGIFTTIKLNGATVLALERQGELRGGSIGVITHWARGRFDNVSLAQRVSRPPSQL